VFISRSISIIQALQPQTSAINIYIYIYIYMQRHTFHCISSPEVVLDRQSCLAVLERRRDEIIAINAMITASSQWTPVGEIELAGREPAVAFWHDVSGACVLPGCIAKALLSSVQLGGLDVFVYAYSEYENMPKAVHIRDANTIMPKLEFDGLLDKLSGKLALLSDLIRFRAIQQDFSMRARVWFWDCDTFCVQQVKDIKVHPLAFDHVVATMRNTDALRKAAPAQELYWMTRYTATPGDKLWTSSPIRFRRESPLAAALLKSAERACYAGSKEYNTIMKEVGRLVRTLGFQNACLPPEAFNGVHTGITFKAIQDNAVVDVTLPGLLDKAFGFNNLWQSGKSCDGRSVLERGSLDRVGPASIWGRLLHEIDMRLAGSSVQLDRPSKRLRFKTSPNANKDAIPWPEPPFPLPLARSYCLVPFAQTHLATNYTLVEEIGAGTFGKVYKARAADSSPPIAVKIMLSQDLDRPVDQQEAAVIHRIQGDNIITLYDMFISPYFTVMAIELMDFDLRGLQAKLPSKCFLPSVARAVVANVANGIHRLHSLGLMHRDLHARNVLVTLRDSSARSLDCLTASSLMSVKVTDLGKAALITDAFLKKKDRELERRLRVKGHHATRDFVPQRNALG
jgi:hypothetical protein